MTSLLQNDIIDYIWDFYYYDGNIPFHIDNKKALDFWLKLQLQDLNNQELNNILNDLKQYRPDNIHPFTSLQGFLDSIKRLHTIEYNQENESFKIEDDIIPIDNIVDYVNRNWSREDGGLMPKDVAYLLAQADDSRNLRKILELYSDAYIENGELYDLSMVPLYIKSLNHFDQYYIRKFLQDAAKLTTLDQIKQFLDSANDDILRYIPLITDTPITITSVDINIWDAFDTPYENPSLQYLPRTAQLLNKIMSYE